MVKVFEEILKKLLTLSCLSCVFTISRVYTYIASRLELLSSLKFKIALRHVSAFWSSGRVESVAIVLYRFEKNKRQAHSFLIAFGSLASSASG